jgi:myxalamid-type nonribosomal peptide synthetase MxaA
MEQFSRHFVRLAESVVKAPESKVKSLALLTPEDMDACKQWNATDLSLDPSDTLISLFEQQAGMHPDAVALCHEETIYSFQTLHERANRIAAWLCANGAEPGHFVALCLERSPELIVSMLGILKAGAAYLPLDPKYPEERLAYMLKDSRAYILITQRNDLSVRLEAGHPDIKVLFAEDNLFMGEDRDNVVDGGYNRHAKPDDAAYLIYTSGSTGNPKGVVVEHRNAAAIIAWARNYFDAESLRGMLASTSVCFDLSIFEIFVPLCTGNAIVLIDDLLQLPASPFAELVTLVNTVPSAMSALLHAYLPSNVRTVCMAGEFLPTELVDRVYAIGVGQVFDLYGPTETTTYSTCTLRLRGAPATIGTPIANTRIYLLDDNELQVPPGAMGEIFIGGAGVARGYLDRPELTEDRFVSIPELEPVGRLYRTGDLARQRSDGEIVYLGRRDQQIKLRGHRIELGEIEAALREVSGATQLAVVVQKREAGDILVAFVAHGDVRTIDAKEWIAALRNRLPAYMIPTLIVPLATMPLTPNGKIDRKALSLLQKAVADESEGPDSREAPRDLLEQWVANIWAHRLGLKYIARKAHFFEDLGGHSLVAFEIFTEIEARIGVAMMLATLLQASTVELLAGAIRRQGCKPLNHLDFVAAGSADTVIYLVGEAVEAPIEGQRASGERVMSIGYTNGMAEHDAWAREIAALEATQPALVLIGSNAASEDIRKLAAALINVGFANVAMRFLESR